MRAASKRLAEDGGQIREGIESVREDLAQVKDQVVDTGRRFLSEGTGVLKDSAVKVGKRAQSAHEALREFTANRPTTGLLIALGVGAVLGMMLIRRR